MTKSKIYKIVTLFFLSCIIIATIIYSQLTNRHRAIVKTFFLQKSGLVDNRWDVNAATETYTIISPTFYVDGIYKSMEGPQSSTLLQLSKDSTLLFLTGFHVKAIDSKSNKNLSNDFICHTNIDFNDYKYYSHFNLENRIGSQYPRLTSLSNGLENFSLPNGFGVPMVGNDILNVTTEALNHNNPEERRFLKHQISIDYTRKKNTKPLMSRTVFIMLPYDKQNPYKSPVDPAKNLCIPVETKNHSYIDKKGNTLSGHWVIGTGKNTYHSAIDEQLQIKDSLKLHAAAIHVHPFATSLSIYDATTKKIIFTSTIINHTKNIGLTKMNAFSSEEGIWLYKNHHYELILEVNNTSKIKQDMMGSMFLFFYDKELDAQLKKQY